MATNAERLMAVPQEPDPERELARQVGLLVRAARLKAGKSQEDLANDCGRGVTRQTVYRVERGLNTTLGTLGRIAAALDVSLADLMPRDLGFFVAGASGTPVAPSSRPLLPKSAPRTPRTGWFACDAVTSEAA